MTVSRASLVCTCVYILNSCSTYTCTCRTVFLISLYGAPLAQRVSYLALQSSLFGPMVQVIMIIIIITNSINSLLIGSNVFPMSHTLTIVEPIWPMLQNLSKTVM